MNTAQSDTRPFWRRYFWPLLLAILVVLGYQLVQASFEVKVTEAQAQALIDQQLVKLQAENPAYETLEVTVHFLNDELTLEASGEYTLTVGTFPAQHLVTSLISTGDPDYRRGSIYFNASAFELEQFLINDEEPVEVVKRLIAAAATEIVPEARNSILGNARVQGVLDNLGVSVDVIKNDAAISGAALIAEGLVDEYRAEGQALLQASVLRVLERTPLYTLGKNWKEQVAMAALSDIGIKDGVFTATLTGLQILKTIAVLFFSLLLAVGWLIALARGNGSGLAAVVILGSLGN